jgi:hypothetical protein
LDFHLPALYFCPTLPNSIPAGPKSGIPAASALAFTVAPHLQLINYRGCFCRFDGI